jgi:hypothetical protein
MQTGSSETLIGWKFGNTTYAICHSIGPNGVSVAMDSVVHRIAIFPPPLHWGSLRSITFSEFALQIFFTPSPVFCYWLLHCKDKMPKIWNKYSQKRNIGVSVPMSKFMCLWAIYIFPGSVHIFHCSRIGPILKIYKSLTDIWVQELGDRTL